MQKATDPKALIKIGSDPIILHLIRTFIKYNISEFVLCLGYKKTISYFLKKFKSKIKILKKKV